MDNSDVNKLLHASHVSRYARRESSVAESSLNERGSQVLFYIFVLACTSDIRPELSK